MAQKIKPSRFVVILDGLTKLVSSVAKLVSLYKDLFL